jgi:hypothetical protein
MGAGFMFLGLVGAGAALATVIAAAMLYAHDLLHK